MHSKHRGKSGIWIYYSDTIYSNYQQPQSSLNTATGPPYANSWSTYTIRAIEGLPPDPSHTIVYRLSPSLHRSVPAPPDQDCSIEYLYLEIWSNGTKNSGSA